MANNKVYADYLMHGRTKGSRNGISTTKGYTAVGQRAKGRYINGRYVYELGAQGSYRPQATNSRNGRYTKKLTFDTPKSYGAHPETKEDTYMIRDGKHVYETPSAPAGVATYPTKKKDWAKEAASYDNHVSVSPQGGWDAEMLRKRSKWLSNKAQAQGAANNWQQQGDAYRSALTMNNSNSRVQDYRGMPASVTSEIISRDNAKMEKRPEVKAFNAWHNARQQHNAEVAGRNAAYENARKASLKNEAKSARENAVSQAAAERKAREAALGRQKKASMQNAGKKNNWQQAANKTSGILGNMSREDRSFMKSHETRYHDKNGKLHINGGFNVNNKYGYSNYTKDDKGWHDVHFGEYNTAGVKGVKKQQDWNTSFERNHRSDIGNAIADAKEDAKKAFKEAKADAKQTYVNLKSKLKSKFKKKKK